MTQPKPLYENATQMGDGDSFDLGQRIRTARAWSGLGQDELAEMVGVSSPTISRWETNKTAPRVDDISALANACGVAEAFFSRTNPGLTAPERFAQAFEQHRPSTRP